MKKILVIQQKMIGDVLTSSILFEILKDKYPAAELHYAVNAFTVPVIMQHPHIDKLQVIGKKETESKAAFYQFLLKIRKERYDLVIDAYGKLSSNLMTLFSGAEKRIGKRKWYSSWIYSEVFKESLVPKTKAGLAIENRLQLLSTVCPIKDPIPPKIYLSKTEIEQAKLILLEANLDLSKPIIMLSVLGSDESKTYPLPYMASLIDLIANHSQAQLLFNYMPRQKAKAEELFQLCKSSTQSQSKLELLGSDLRSFLAISAHCSALIGNEGGAVNMAKALGIPTFTIFSPWILKEAWNMFEDGKKHVSVHLKDFKPALFKEEFKKNNKKEAGQMYLAFKPKYIEPALVSYLTNGGVLGNTM